MDTMFENLDFRLKQKDYSSILKNTLQNKED